MEKAPRPAPRSLRHCLWASKPESPRRPRKRLLWRSRPRPSAPRSNNETLDHLLSVGFDQRQCAHPAPRRKPIRTAYFEKVPLMPDSRTRIIPEVDFAKDGRQHGYLRLFHSVHSSAYGFIPIPIVVLKHGEGPTALFVSGNHGDEYEGQVAL